MNTPSTLSEQFTRHAFAPLETLAQHDHDSARARVFKGDGTPYLRCPGLKKLERVKMHGTSLPDTLIYDVPVDASLRRFERIVMPTVVMDVAHDGTPILRRNLCSNDGNWQDEVLFTIIGEWDASVIEVAPEVTEKRKGRK